MRVDVGAATDIGQVRDGNEDSYLLLEPLFAVADGMGGHLGGEVASNLALETIRDAFAAGEGALVDQVTTANRVVFERSQSDREVRGMGTTLTAALVEGAQVRLVHVGDSRCYLLRDGELHMLTKDHTVVAKMVEEGEITAAEAESHPHRNIVTRVLGVEANVEVDEGILDLRDGDRLLLCSDGLTGMVPDADIEAVLRDESDPQRAVERLIRDANDAGGVDNITAVLLDFHGDDGGRSAASDVVLRPASTRVDTGEHPTARPTGVATAQRTKAQTGVMPIRTPVPPSARPRPEPRRASRGGPSRRTWISVGVAILLLVVAFVGVRLFLDSQWYVGISDGRVAIFQGVPSEVAGVELHSVVVETDVPAAKAAALPVWADLPDGITANDRAEAEAIVSSIEKDVAASQSKFESRSDGGM
jgi:serine/threonine protein phosphatase PrpC